MNGGFGLTAYNNMKSSKVVVVEREKISKDNYVILPPMVVEMLSVMDSFDIDLETYQNILERQFFYFHRERRETLPRQEFNRIMGSQKFQTDENPYTYRNYIFSVTEKFFNKMEFDLYHILNHSKNMPQYNRQMYTLARQLQETCVKNGKNINMETAMMAIEDLKNTVIQKMAILEIAFESYGKNSPDEKTESYENILQIINNKLKYTSGITKRGCIMYNNGKIPKNIAKKLNEHLFNNEHNSISRIPFWSDLITLLGKSKSTHKLIMGQPNGFQMIGDPPPEFHDFNIDYIIPNIDETGKVTPQCEHTEFSIAYNLLKEAIGIVHMKMLDNKYSNNQNTR